MTVHAIIGATGGTGTAILRSLLLSNDPDLTVNVFVRSKQKLLASFPDLEHRSNVSIFIGAVADSGPLIACVTNADVIYHCIGANAPSRITTMARNAAKAVTSALQHLERTAKGNSHAPTILFNRSLALSKDVKVPIPTPMAKLFFWLLNDIYADLVAAIDLYTKADQDGLLNLIIVDPPGLFDKMGSERTGHEIVLKGAVGHSMNYADLGAAFVEVAERRAEFRGRIVGVGATGKVREAWFGHFITAMSGLRYRLTPF